MLFHEYYLSLFPFDVKPYVHQPYYYPNQEKGPWFGIYPKDSQLNLSFSDKPPLGTPIYPYAATGLKQYVRPVPYIFNESLKVMIYEWCTSVFGEPTRNQILDGTGGRSNSSIYIASPRPQKPGIPSFQCV